MMIVIGVILTICLSIVFLFIVTPKPTALLVRRLFEGGVAVKPTNYEEIERSVQIENDLSYNSNYNSGKLDIIKPKEYEGYLPVIFWVHGGAFLGGDKSDITEYAVQIASKGYIVININYGLAPNSKYPTPLYQVKEAFQFIDKNAKKYGIDMNRLYFAGDSAGAQIISQFVNVQVDKGYANMLGIEGTVSSDKIKGVLLFCGPYDVSKLSNSSSFLINFLFKRVGWAYIGERNWTNSDKVKEASILQHVSGNFPSTFITDGNIGSFDDQGKELADKLKNKGVEVSQIFYSTEEAKLGHEYQFMMNTLQAENTFNKLIEFLDNTSQKQKN
ncbi:alpha/beta hydrolase [Solibacillus sp. FSL R5-0691]|uniref:alpha/beta hydrolase n=1 Tax=Solibacillus sp. FSL R5-0691 TaxID=2921653 RepID=UPI0030CE3174